MKTKTTKRVLAILLSLVMLISVTGTVYAAGDPSETVYVLLDTKGTARQIIVKKDGAEQENAKGVLPFTINLSYTFNGSPADPEDFVGKSADVKVAVRITPNHDAKPYYKENLALQMQFPIDIGKGFATNLVAKGLTGVTVGSIQTLSGIVLPTKSAAYEISYHTESFKQDSINFVCMPFDLTGMMDMDLSTITSQVTQLTDGISQYVGGVKSVNKGLTKANAGLNQLAANGASLVEGYAQLTDGTNTLLQMLLTSIPPEQQPAFAPYVAQLQKGQKELSAGLSAYTGGVSQTAKGFSELAAGTKELAKNGTTLKEGVESAVAPLEELSTNAGAPAVAESFLSADPVSAIQFVMKTDALSAVKVKEDVVPAQKEKQSFWSRLLALFGL